LYKKVANLIDKNGFGHQNHPLNPPKAFFYFILFYFILFFIFIEGTTETEYCEFVKRELEGPQKLRLGERHGIRYGARFPQKLVI
jgi:hypothetical protein